MSAQIDFVVKKKKYATEIWGQFVNPNIGLANILLSQFF